ncbi:MAG: DUF4838 domain-containing protein [Planctomycetia bacterium]|nr:DUF4838 domain-containing protein [Planctomycetia bacterium]
MLKSFLAVLLLAAPATAAEVVLFRDGKSDYEIVLPDASPTPEFAACLKQTARLVQSAFKANGVEIGIVAEKEHDAAKPAIFLGSTNFALKNGVDTEKLVDWSYVLRVVGRDVIVAGHDQPTPLPIDPRTKQGEGWDRVGTAKAAVDFLRQYLGVRFLYPDLPVRTPISGAAGIDLVKSPAIEYLPLKAAVLPGDLNVAKTPVMRGNMSYPASANFYDLAHNRFPRVDEPFGAHTWETAIPAAKYNAEHPEYFALLSGKRWKAGDGNAQYCLSNPDVQELIYRHMAKQFDEGSAAVDLGQPDGFRECQCEECAKLYDTGKDWSEKIWIFDRIIAERLLKSHPTKYVTLVSYILTENPPKTYSKFPANVRVMLTGTNEEDIAPWRKAEVPAGFYGYIYNSCPNLATRYTPMRTPTYVEAQVKRLTANKIDSIYRDGNGFLFGTEGPVYYTMGRMFDDPQRNSAKELLPEFYEAAFGKAATSMRSFYEQLYHAINLYSDHIGTRNDAWTYRTVEGRGRKSVTDPFQFIAFLYPPNVLSSLDADLSQAERSADTVKVKTRLALVRREFEWIRNLARVVHLYHAFELQPDGPSRERLLDAIDRRNAAVDALYGDRGSPKSDGDWAQVLFPIIGHDAHHLRLKYDGYQEPYSRTCLNWDTKAMRSAPLPGKKRLTVAAAQSEVTFDSPIWKDAAANELTLVTPLIGLPRKTTVRLLYDKTNLYLRAECDLEPAAATEFPVYGRDTDLRGQEAIDLYLAPQAGSDVAYRFMSGADAKSRWDAAAGFITDAIDPRYGQDDPTWNGEWRNETRVDAKAARWEALITIPFKSLGVQPPSAGTTWRGNIARYHPLRPYKVDRSIWSSTLGNASMDDRSVFGEIVFE